MSFEIELLAGGQATLRDTQVQENMHSGVGAWNEANEVYIQQAGFEEALASDNKNPLVIYDIGLGVAANSVAALARLDLLARGGKTRRPLHVISFENDLNGLRTALRHSNYFLFLREFENEIKGLLQTHQIESHTRHGASYKWTLMEGNFPQTLEKAPSPPEIIFYDLYSPKVNPALWNLGCFEKLYQACPVGKGHNAQLITYSSSTAVRAGLILAGFFVRQGKSTPMKKETTLASILKLPRTTYLSNEWLEHWGRSSKPLPEDCSHLDRLKMRALLAKRLDRIFDSGELNHRLPGLIPNP